MMTEALAFLGGLIVGILAAGFYLHSHQAKAIAAVAAAYGKTAAEVEAVVKKV